MTKHTSRFFVFNLWAFLCLVGSFELSAQCAQADGTIMVTNTNATGIGSLHEAINCANNTLGPNTIQFNIPGNFQHVIYVGAGTGAELPTILDPYTVIDATTQPGFGLNGNYTPKIILDGSQFQWDIPINAIFLRADFCEVYGLEIRNFPDDGIDLYQASNCIVGKINKGNVIHSTGSTQDYFSGLPNTGPWQGCGIVVRQNSNNCLVEGNIIGTDANFSSVTGIEYIGILNRSNSHNAQIKNNVITSCEVGIRVDASVSTLLTENSIYCNSNSGITLSNGGNYSKQPPFISSVSTTNIVGSGASGDVAEIYINENSSCVGAPCQGKIFLGSANVVNGQWTLNAPFSNGITLNGGEAITATLRDGGNNTTAFSACQFVPGSNSCAQPDGTIMVTNTNDAGPGSLREAINCANTNIGPNTIQFAIAGNGKHYINVGNTSGEELPALLDANTIIDATTQTGFGLNGNFEPKIVLDGQYNNWDAPINAVWVRADFCEVYGLEVINFPDDGIDVTDAHHCKIGAPNKGNVIYNNGSSVDYFPAVPNTGPWEGCGIILKHNSYNCTVQGNTVGVSYDHTVGNGNEYCGIIVSNGGDNNQIGGSGNGEANYISKNLVGVRISENSDKCEISENIFICNQVTGIELRGNANDNQLPPTIQQVSATSITGNALAGDKIEIYLSDKNNCGTAACQGSVFLGSKTVPLTGQWTLNAPFANGVALNAADEITATSTDPLGNTSQFATCTSFTLNCNLTISSSNYSNTTCNQPNGSISFSAAGGSIPYTYSMGGTTNSTGIFSNLSVGNYNMTVTDAQGCTANESISFTNAFGNPLLSIANFEHTSCGENNGSINLTTSGGLPTYLYDLGQGATTNPNFTNLSPGNYTITVTDGNGCTDTEAISINVSSNIFANIININPPTCNSSNGSLTVSVTGGSGTYGYDIGNGSTPNNSFQNLAAGNYTITVTDSNGCNTTDQISMTSSAGPSVFISTDNASCGQANGVVNITASGGTAPYLYDIGNGQTSNNSITGLSEGNYNVTITDAAGCQEVRPAIINDNGPINLSATNIVHEDCDGSAGSFSAQINGGTAPYFYDIGNGPTINSNFTNLDAGTYNLTVTDLNDCTASTTVNINPGATPGVNIGSLNFANCGLSDGSFLASGYGGMPPYTFDIGNGNSSNNSFTGLAAGDYSVTMTDANGCTAIATTTLGTANGPSATLNNIVDANCGQNNGSFNIIPNGGTPPYSYDIGNGPSSSNSFSNLAAGNYTITITDANTCSTTTTQEIITSGGLPTASFTYVVNTMSISFTTISTDVNSVSWDFGTGNTAPVANPTFNFPGTGTYTICQTVTNQCGSDMTCEDITVIGNDVFTMSVGEAEGSIGTTVSIPVTVENFDEIVGISNSYEIADPTVARFAGTSGHNLTDLGGYSFNFTNTSLTLAWFDISIAGVTVPDNTILFYIDVEILGNVDDCSDILIVDNPTQIEVIQKSGNTEVNVPSVMNLGAVCVTQNLEDLFTMNILEASGSIGTVVSIPVTVENFDDIVGVSSSFQIANPSVARFVGTSGYDLTDLGGYSFNFDNTTLTISWFDLSIAGVSVADHTTIFYLDVEILGNVADCSDLVIDGNPTEIEIIKKSGNTEISVPSVMNPGSVCVTQNLEDLFTMSVLEADGAVGSIVSIPVSFENFNDIVGVSNSFQIADPAVAKFMGTSGHNLSDLGAYSFNVSDNTITLSWFDLSIAGITVPDNTILFYLDVEMIGNGGDCTAIIVDGNPTAIEIIKKSGNSEVSIPYAVNDGSVCTLQPAAAIVIAGVVEKENGVAVRDVELTCTGGYLDWSIPTGEYSFPDMMPSINYTIDPKKDTLYAAGVSTIDLVRIQEHILASNILNSPYKIIAADVNNSGSITTLDLIYLQDIILARADTFPNNESWRFVPESYVFTDPTNPFLDNFPEVISLNSPTMDEMEQDFVGIKVGDVNLSSSAFMPGEIEENVLLEIADQPYLKGEEIEIAFTAKQFEEIGGMQGDIIFNPEILAFKEVISGTLPGFSNNNIGTKYLKNGVLPFSWFNPNYSENGVTLYDDETLYIMRFEVLQSGNSLNEVIQIGSVNTKLEVFKSNYTFCNLTLEVNPGTVAVDDNPTDISNQNIACSPNPFSENTMINFILPEQDRIALTIHDSNGVLIKTFNQSLGQGHHVLCITADDLPSFGIYFYRLSTSADEYVGKMIHLNRQ